MTLRANKTAGIAPPRSTVRRGSLGQRIPATLQAVFLASNRGKDVYKPPPEKAAFREFFKRQTWAGLWNPAANNNSSAVDWLAPPRGLKKKKSRKKKKKDGKSSTEKSTTSASTKQSKTRKSKNAAPISVVKFRPKSTASSAASTLGLSFALNPQTLLDAMITKRGYSTERYATLNSAYYNKPTPLQQASYDRFLIGLARSQQYTAFEALMESGISLNPCNAHGESLVHLIARLGDVRLMEILVRLGCSLQVADDYGRTPLHDACWGAKPNFEMIQLILNVDRRLIFLTDSRGALPLSYVHKDHWNGWLDFLDSQKDAYWPVRDVEVLGPEAPPQLCLLGANTRPTMDPDNAFTAELAGMVASGKITPAEAEVLRDDVGDDKTTAETETEVDTEHGDRDDSSELSSDFDSDDDSSFSDDDYLSDENSFEAREMDLILQDLPVRSSRRLQ